MYVTYRATVTAMLHIGPHECQNRQIVSIWSRYDIFYHNLPSRKFPCKFCGIIVIGRSDRCTATKRRKRLWFVRHHICCCVVFGKRPDSRCDKADNVKESIDGLF